MPGQAQDKNATLNGIKALYDAIQPYLNGGTHAGFTPVGSIIAIMGNEAPTHYLKCDGTVYNIVDYPDLAAYFEQQFEAKNYFGGDGIDTFAVPDLQGEFLRGAGTNSHTNQGSGEDVGEHQDATELLSQIFSAKTNGGQFVGGTESVYRDPANDDSSYGTASTVITQAQGTGSYTGESRYPKITSRPTNTSVLYCIATKNIFVDVTDFGEAVDAEDIAAIIAEEPPVARNNFQEYSTNEQIVGRWIDGKPLYQKSYNVGIIPINDNPLLFAHNISNIGVIVSTTGFAYDGSNICLPLPYVSYYASNINIQLYSDKTNIVIRQGGNGWSNYTGYVTLQYTKTTDTV